MLQRRSTLAARRAERPLLAPLWLILLLGTITVTALVFIYPQRDLVRRIGEAPESELSDAYLTNLLRSDPKNPQLRLLLARQELHQGDPAKARAALLPALETAGTPALRRDALWLLWQIIKAEEAALPAGETARRKALQAELRSRLTDLAQEDWPPETALAIADQAFAMNERALAIKLYKESAGGDPARAVGLYDKAAHEALASGNYQACAELYLLARQNAREPWLARQYFQAALRALQSGNMPGAALELGERELGPLADDPETLIQLVNLARAAGRPDIAERYVRHLLKLSVLHRWNQLEFARAYGDGDFRKVGLNNREGGPGIAFDNRTYSLGYDVFLENHKLEDAWKVAASAVRQAPADPAWRERLAKVSEWTGRPDLALENWLALARQTNRDDAWQSVLRMAPGLFNDQALLGALHYQIDREPNDLRLLKELVATYERLGDPQAALAYLDRFNRQHASPASLELAAELAERAGQPSVAIAAWQRLFENPAQITPARAVRAAVLLMVQNRGNEGLRWLEAAKPQAGHDSPQDIDFWRLMAEFASLAEQEGEAVGALRLVVSSDHANERDYTALIDLLEVRYPAEAATVAASAWDRFDRPAFLIQALNFYAGQSQWREMGALLGRIDAAPGAKRHSLRALRQLPEFLNLAGTYYSNIGDLRQARLYLEAGLKLTPGSASLQQALLWLYVDSHDVAALRRMLANGEAAWQSDPATHDILAAAYQALSRPQVALDRYLTPHLAEHRTDFLWLMNYADALEQNQQADRAWRLRRQLLADEWQGEGKPAGRLAARRQWLTEEGLAQTRRLARARLLLTQRAGDTGLDALRELLRLDRDGQGKLSNAAAEVALGWLQDAGEYNAERGFLWQQYAQARSRPVNQPLWAEITLALATEDKTASGALLESAGEGLPRYDLVNAARAVDDLRLAQSAAFEIQSDQPDDEPLHMQLEESLLEFSDSAGARLALHELGSIDETDDSVHYHAAIDPHLSLDFGWGRISRRTIDETVFSNVPNEQYSGVKLNWRHDDGMTTFLAEQRDSFARYTPLQIAHEQRIDNRLTLLADLGTQLPAQDTLPLRIAGMKDRAALSLRYRPTRLDQLVVEYADERYKLQTGADLGSGRHTTFTLSHAYRQEVRDLEFSAFWSSHQYDQRTDTSGWSNRDLTYLKYMPAGSPPPGASYFLPDNFNFYGLRVSTDERYEEQYTRAARPYASLSRTWHTELGPGYDARLGMASSVLGADHLSLTWGQNKSGLQSNGTVRDLLLAYRIHY